MMLASSIMVSLMGVIRTGTVIGAFFRTIDLGDGSEDNKKRLMENPSTAQQ
jgi:hypothetical protein